MGHVVVVAIGVLNCSVDEGYLNYFRQQIIVIRASVGAEPCKQFKSLLQQLLVLQFSIACSR